MAESVGDADEIAGAVDALLEDSYLEDLAEEYFGEEEEADTSHHDISQQELEDIFGQDDSLEAPVEINPSLVSITVCAVYCMGQNIIISLIHVCVWRKKDLKT